MARAVIAVPVGPVDLNLQRIADGYGLPVFDGPNAREVLRQVLGTRAGVVIVQLSEPVETALQLIRVVTACGRRMRVIAAATCHSEDVERRACRSGATGYLADLGSPLVDRVVEMAVDAAK